MKCPECNKPLIWNNDFDYDDQEEFLFYSMYSCTPCNIEVTKNHPKG